MKKITVKDFSIFSNTLLDHTAKEVMCYYTRTNPDYYIVDYVISPELVNSGIMIKYLTNNLYGE